MNYFKWDVFILSFIKAVCSDDYRQCMYVLFGTNFSKMFCGPMWSLEPTCQGDVIPGKIRDPLKVKEFGCM